MENGRAGSRPLDIRALHTIEDFERVVALEVEVWGEASRGDVVSVPMFAATVKTGAILLGAFRPADRLVGFAYSFPGLRHGRLLHWSHMTGVVEKLRGDGIGYALKVEQRRLVREAGIDLIEWTFDPLQAVNAHFNFVRLGVVASEYAENIYGSSVSPLHRGAPTDRLVVQWHIDTAHVARRLSSNGLAARTSEVARAAVVNPADAGDGWMRPAGDIDLETDASRLLVNVPGHYTNMLAASGDLALEWRLSTRAVFETYFARGYRAVDFFLDRATGSGQYLLARAR